MGLAVDAALADLAAQVGDCGAVAPEGGRTRWEAGGPVASEARPVRAPAGIVEHKPEEMTVRVRAGTTVADLNATLAERGQRCALVERGGTVGGALAVGEDHLEVLGRGRTRSGVLEVRYVSAEGKVITGGGPTVKNVTGFDLPRLMVGSLGTLGVLGEAVLRTNPIPAESRWLTSPGVDPFEAARLSAKPSAVLWDGSRTWVLLEGHRVDVDAQAAALEELARWEPADGAPPIPAHRWSLRPSALRVLDAAATGPFVASIGVGLVLATNPPPHRAPDASLVTLTDRVKREFDPTGRLNPGRVVLGTTPTGAR